MEQSEERGKIIEQGNVYFLYRPKVRAAGEETRVRGAQSIQRLYMVLSPHGKDVYRLLVLGRKRLPKVKDGGGRY